MTEFGIVGLAIIIITVLASYQGFRNPAYLSQYAFRVKDILYKREYYRLLTSGFLHVGWVHLLMNMLTFYWFSSSVEDMVGYRNYAIIYFGSMLGGSLLSLLLHRRESEYTAVGASGAISGLVFAAIALFPEIKVGIPEVLMVPGWLYGLLYVLFCAYGITKRLGNIGHDAHLGGGLVGLLTVVLMRPELLRTNALAIGAVLLPALVFFILLLRKPGALLTGSLIKATPDYQTIDDQYQTRQHTQEAELDALLDKISHKGFDSLSAREKRQLEELSR